MSFQRPNSFRESGGGNITILGDEKLHTEFQQIIGGFLFTHHRMNFNTSKALEVASFLYALIDMLKDKGLISIEELDERKKVVAERLVKKFEQKGIGAVLFKSPHDKYAYEEEVQIECDSRLHLCEAACCRFAFPLSQQDIEQRIINWDLEYPYMNARDEEGYCKHLDKKICRCTVWKHRPIPCRAFDCRKDQRIWLDFDRKIINPKLPDLFKSDDGNGKYFNASESNVSGIASGRA